MDVVLLLTSNNMLVGGDFARFLANIPTIYWIPFSELPLVPPVCEGLPPVSWWDADADKSLLVGTFKHGFERYNMMRLDPALCFLAKCGPPDNAAVQVRIQKTDKYGRVSSL